MQNVAIFRYSEAILCVNYAPNSTKVLFYAFLL
jgi:hypothetical protein